MQTFACQTPRAGADHRVAHLGPGAALTLAAGSGVVLGVFERCIYLRAESGEIACLGPRELGDGALQISLAGVCPRRWNRAGIRPADRWRYAESKLIVADRWVFDLRGACSWYPQPPSMPGAPVSVAGCLSRLSWTIRSHLPGVGLGALIPALAMIPEGGVARSAPPWSAAATFDPVLRTAQDHIGALFGAAGFDGNCLAELAHRLLGLGPGLTPSGDDFVAGLLIALRHLGATEIAECIGRRILPESTRRTNAISAAHLLWAAQGVGAAPLHGVLQALCRADAAMLQANVLELTRIGHCSGWDALAGAVLGCAIWSLHPTSERAAWESLC